MNIKYKSILVAFFFSIIACNNTNDKSVNENITEYKLIDYILSEEEHSYIIRIDKIHIYNTDRNLILHTTGSNIGENLTENIVRATGNITIINNSNSRTQVIYIIALLNMAKRIYIDPNTIPAQIETRDGIRSSMFNGCVIDIYDKNGNIIKTYIKKYEYDVFYIKGEENIFYEMPELLTNKYLISYRDFILAYNEAIGNQE